MVIVHELVLAGYCFIAGVIATQLFLVPAVEYTFVEKVIYGLTSVAWPVLLVVLLTIILLHVFALAFGAMAESLIDGLAKAREGRRRFLGARRRVPTLPGRLASSRVFWLTKATTRHR
jgi:hypothetical protein